MSNAESVFNAAAAQRRSFFISLLMLSYSAHGNHHTAQQYNAPRFAVESKSLDVFPESDHRPSISYQRNEQNRSNRNRLPGEIPIIRNSCSDSTFNVSPIDRLRFQTAWSDFIAAVQNIIRRRAFGPHHRIGFASCGRRFDDHKNC